MVHVPNIWVLGFRVYNIWVPGFAEEEVLG